MIRELLQRSESRILLSFVVGVGISVLLFHRARKEYVVSAIDIAQLSQAINRIDNKCYRFRITDASEPSA
jgi:hypothetical protein